MCIYKYIISYLRNKEYKITFKKGERSGQEIALPSFENMENFGYSVLQNPLRSLIISYPYKEFNETIKNIENDKYSKHKHSHSLVKTDDNNIIVIQHNTILHTIFCIILYL